MAPPLARFSRVINHPSPTIPLVTENHMGQPQWSDRYSTQSHVEAGVRHDEDNDEEGPPSLVSLTPSPPSVSPTNSPRLAPTSVSRPIFPGLPQNFFLTAPLNVEQTATQDAHEQDEIDLNYAVWGLPTTAPSDGSEVRALSPIPEALSPGVSNLTDDDMDLEARSHIPDHLHVDGGAHDRLIQDALDAANEALGRLTTALRRPHSSSLAREHFILRSDRFPGAEVEVDLRQEALHLDHQFATQSVLTPYHVSVPVAVADAITRQSDRFQVPRYAVLGPPLLGFFSRGRTVVLTNGLSQTVTLVRNHGQCHQRPSCLVLEAEFVHRGTTYSKTLLAPAELVADSFEATDHPFTAFMGGAGHVLHDYGLADCQDVVTYGISLSVYALDDGYRRFETVLWPSDEN